MTTKRKLSTTRLFVSSKQLNLYKKSYKGGGTKDVHFKKFQETLRLTDATRVLYPGCHRHLTASLVFQNVTYVDCDRKVAPLYDISDAAVVDYVETNKVYNEDSNYKFYCCNVENTKILNNISEEDESSSSFDLLISLSAGAMAEPCTKYMPPLGGGFLLVNDAHSDARTIFVGQDWQLYAYWDDETSSFVTADLDLDRCFQVIVPKSKKTIPISVEQVKESFDIGTVRKRSFKLLFEPMFFLFQRK